VLKTAGFSYKRDNTDDPRGIRPSRSLLDLGFGCGDQSIYLMSQVPGQESDAGWWDHRSRVPRFDSYTGITLDYRQFIYAEDRIKKLQGKYIQNRKLDERVSGIQNTRLFCADAANPDSWNDDLKSRILLTSVAVKEYWVLGLDMLYHLSPSRWRIIDYSSRTLNASFMAFDLCIASDISASNKLVLRLLTALMGAPWDNFVTQGQYRTKLVEAGYRDITIRDVSEHVFAPLVNFLNEQDQMLRTIGYGLGPFHVARWMFTWWARTGVIRGVIVVAKHFPRDETAS
jgi:hypothetical protein